MRRYFQFSPFCCCFAASHPNFSSSSSKTASAQAKNFYEILGVPMCAGQEEIKRAYFRKSKEFHPDLNPEDPSAEEFQRVKRAYDVLRSVERRKRYDAFLLPSQLFHQKIRTNSNTNEFEEFSEFEATGQNWQTPPPNEWAYYEFYQRTKKADTGQMSGWNGPGLSIRQELLMFIKYFAYFGLSLIFIYYTSLWYVRHRREKKLENLVPSEEVAKSFLRQREVTERDSPMQREVYARLFGDYIDEAERRKREDPEYERKRKEEWKRMGAKGIK